MLFLGAFVKEVVGSRFAWWWGRETTAIEFLDIHIVRRNPAPTPADSNDKTIVITPRNYERHHFYADVQFTNIGSKTIDDATIRFPGAIGQTRITVDGDEKETFPFESIASIGECPQNSIIRVEAWYDTDRSTVRDPVMNWNSGEGGSVPLIAAKEQSTLLDRLDQATQDAFASHEETADALVELLKRTTSERNALKEKVQELQMLFETQKGIS